VSRSAPDVKHRREHTRHEKGSPVPRPAPTEVPIAKTKNGRVRCPGCGQWYSGLAWGDTSPCCGIVRLADGGWWPFEDEQIDNETLVRDDGGSGLVAGGGGGQR